MGTKIHEITTRTEGLRTKSSIGDCMNYAKKKHIPYEHVVRNLTL